MDGPDPPQPKPETTAMGVLDRLLAFMTTPWKAVAVVVLLVVCAALYFIYLERARIADAILREPITAPHLEVAKFVKDAANLLHDTRGDLAVIIELHLIDNITIDRVGIDRDGNRWVPIEGPQPAISPDGSAAMIARFLQNQVVCLDTAKTASEEGRTLARNGYERLCLVSVPPVLGVGVGALLIAWKTPLPPSAEARAGLVMASAAMKFATW